jgi:DNA-binding NtrC family response regulator
LDELGTGRHIDELFPPEALERLRQHHWPGNVRELRNVIDATIAMGEAVSPHASRPPREAGSVPLGIPYGEARSQVLNDFERVYLRHLLDAADDNVSKAARVAQMNRSHLFTLLRRHGLR